MLYVGIEIWKKYSFKGALTNTQHFGGARMCFLNIFCNICMHSFFCLVMWILFLEQVLIIKGPIHGVSC
jgi:hypothetical protein